MNFAGFFSRLLALLVDNIAVSVLAWIVAALLGGAIGLTAGTGSGFLNFVSSTLALLTMVILFFFQFIYFGWMWSQSGQTVGMKLTNIKVVRQESEALPNFWRAGLRGTVGYYISGLVFSLGFIWAAFDGNKETWHDKLFDTWVVID